MSLDAMLAVFRHSPYKLATRLVHLAIAEVVSEAHGWEYWGGDDALASAANVERHTVVRAKSQMVEDGFLIDLGKHSSGSRWYRFVPPQGNNLFHADGTSTRADGTSTTSAHSSYPEEQKGRTRTRIPDPFLLTADMRKWAKTHASDVDLRTATEEFVTYWRGDGRTKLDWEQTWRNSMLKAQQRARPHAVANGANPDGLTYDPDRPDISR